MNERSKHTNKGNTGRKFSEAHKQKLREAAIRRSTPAYRAAMSDSVRNSEAHKADSESRRGKKIEMTPEQHKKRSEIQRKSFQEHLERGEAISIRQKQSWETTDRRDKVKRRIYLDKNVIVEEYVNNRRSISYLCELFDVSYETIKRELDELKIETRPSSAYKHHEHTDATRKLMSEHRKGISPPSMFGDKNPSKRLIVREKISRKLKGKPGMCGKDNPNWHDGASKGDYCEDFDEPLKEKVRSKYDYRCFICNKSQFDNVTKRGKIIKLHVHHIYYDKQEGCNGHHFRLVPLCTSCHMRTTSGNREYWTHYIMDKLVEMSMRIVFSEGPS